MKRVALAIALGAVVADGASAAFVQYVVTKTQTSNSGIALDVYRLSARFNGATDTVLNAFNLCRVDGGPTDIFYHKDLGSSNSGVLSRSFGTWNPAQTGSSTQNRPFDSYLSIGCISGPNNTTNADPSWTQAPGGDARGWNRPDIPQNCLVGWFNASPPNNQGRVGLGGNTATDVCLGQFVLDQGANGGTWSLRIGYNSGVTGTPVLFADGLFSLPAPGAIALIGLAGLTTRRRR